MMGDRINRTFTQPADTRVIDTPRKTDNNKNAKATRLAHPIKPATVTKHDVSGSLIKGGISGKDFLGKLALRETGTGQKTISLDTSIEGTRGTLAAEKYLDDKIDICFSHDNFSHDNFSHDNLSHDTLKATPDEIAEFRALLKKDRLDAKEERTVARMFDELGRLPGNRVTELKLARVTYADSRKLDDHRPFFKSSFHQSPAKKGIEGGPLLNVLRGNEQPSVDELESAYDVLFCADNLTPEFQQYASVLKTSLQTLLLRFAEKSDNKSTENRSNHLEGRETGLSSIIISKSVVSICDSVKSEKGGIYIHKISDIQEVAYLDDNDRLGEIFPHLSETQIDSLSASIKSKRAAFLDTLFATGGNKAPQENSDWQAEANAYTRV